MKGLIILLGESFRLGGQWSRNRGDIQSYDEQINACKSHIRFIEHISNKYKLDSLSVYILTYTTQFDSKLLDVYNKYLIGQTIYNEPIGLNNLYHNSISKINTVEQYDFILYLRIDIFLYDEFNLIFNPMWSTIHYPCVCWFRESKCRNYPRVNNMMLFIPKKYYYILNTSIDISYHDGWANLIEKGNLTYNDLDVMINTYHDSDTAKDYNPLYYIVNRPKANIWHSTDHIFIKKIIGLNIDSKL